MLRILFRILICHAYFTFLFAEEGGFTPPEEPFASSLVKTQNLLSTVVDSISAISGEWIHSETDFVVLGPEPLILNRNYTGDHAHNDKLGYNWDFSRPHKLIVDIQEKKIHYAQAVARLHQSSGVATIHESSTHQGKLEETIIPLLLSRTQGLTNCRGEMSAKTNLHNTIIQLDLKGKHCAAVTGSGLLTYYEFSHQQNLTRWKTGKIGVGYYKGHVLNHYRPVYERKPNGNTLHFKKGMIAAANASNTETYCHIQFRNEGIDTLSVRASDGKTATYKFATYDHPVMGNPGLRAFFPHRFYLTEASFSHKPSETYEYTHHPPSQPTEHPKNPLLKAKRQPGGRYEEVEYYHKGTNQVDMSTDLVQEARAIHLDHEDDFRIHRVKVRKAPVGHDAKPLITHRFIYEADSHGQPQKKTDPVFSGRTKVYDAYLRKTVYEYNKEHRPTRIKRYDGNKQLYSEECYTWDDRYVFPSDLVSEKGKQKLSLTQSDISAQFVSTLSTSIGSALPQATVSKKEQIEKLIKACFKSHILQTSGAGNLLGKYEKDAGGNILYARFFEYDDKGNVTHDRFYGNLKGIQPQTIELNAHHKPRRNGCECYEKRFTYSNDKLNLLKSEEEENGKGISYEYVPETDLVAAKYVKENGVIRLRQFFHYDSNATLIKQVKDDGCEKEESNWNGVTERQMTTISPRKAAPLGLPECIEHRYIDGVTGSETLLKKIDCHYSLEGHLLQQDTYDAHNELRYSLNWDYDAHGNVIREVNALGHEILKDYDANDNLILERGPRPGDCKEYTYDFANRLISIKTEGDGNSWSIYYQYDLVGNRIAEIDRYGNETRYEFDDFNRLARTLYPAIEGQPHRPYTETLYDCLDRPILETDARGFSTAKTYNARGKLTSLLHPDGQLERFEYHLDGTLAKKIAPNGTSIHYTYDCFGRLLTEKALSASGQFLYETRHAYNSLHKTSSTDAEGVTTYFEYNGAGRLIQTRCLDKMEIYEYDPLGRLAKKKEPFGSGKIKVTCTEHDFLDRIVEERIEDENGKILKRVRYDYDLLSNRTHVMEETGAGLSQYITFYNQDKKPIRTIDPEGNETHVIYDAVRNSLGQLVLQTRTTDPLGRQTIITHDAMERPVNTKKQDINGVLLSHQDLFYDGKGNLLRLIDHVIVHGQETRSIQTSFAYQEMGQLTCLTQAERLPEQQITHTKYNAYGQKEKVIKSDGVTLSFTYDPLGRLKTHTSSDYSIDTIYQYNLRHQVLQVEDRTRQVFSDFQYDERGRLLNETLSTDISIAYAYDLLDRVIALTLPDASQIAYSYDALNLKQIDRIKNQQCLYSHRYDVFDLAGLNLKSIAINQQDHLFRYDLQKRPLSIENGSFKQTHAQYDGGGRLFRYHVQDAIGSAEIRFDFDDHDHLIHEEGHAQHVYACDSLHNRLSKNQVPHVSNALHQLTHNGEDTFTYDQTGNLIAKQKDNRGDTYQYDALDRLIAVHTSQETVRYLYDAFNRRVAKIQGDQTTRYIYVGQDEIGSMDEVGNILELRILGQGHGAEIGASIAIELNNQVYQPSHDFQGNVVALADLSGHVVETYRYTAFGETTIYNSAGEKVTASQIGNPWQFSSKRVDEESGFVYFGRRYYDPANGRWITADPAGWGDGSNLYAYLHHRPVQAFDLYGLEEEPYYPLQHVDHDRAEPLQKEENQQNQEAPLGFVEKRRGKKDRMFFSGLHQIAEMGFSSINGILNSLKDASVTAKALSEMAGDHYVTFVYNETRGFIADVCRSFFELYFYMDTKACKDLRNSWDAHFNFAGPDSYLIHFCHSEGAIITRNALMRYPEELRQRIIVIAIAPAAYIDDKYAFQVIHYRSTRDIVPLFDFVGAYRCRESTVVLKPHPDAPFFDHPIDSPTYQNLKYEHLTQYRERFGSTTCNQSE